MGLSFVLYRVPLTFECSKLASTSSAALKITFRFLKFSFRKRFPQREEKSIFFSSQWKIWDFGTDCGYELVTYWMTEQETSKESSPSMVSVQYFSSLSLCFIAVVMNFLLVESRSKNILLHLRQSRLCLNAYWKYIGYALKFRLRFTSNWYSYSTYFALDTEAMWIIRF